jgi:hypothetical protein
MDPANMKGRNDSRLDGFSAVSAGRWRECHAALELICVCLAESPSYNDPIDQFDVNAIKERANATR